MERSDSSAVRPAVEQATPGSVVHAVAKEGIETGAIAEAISARLTIPVESIAPDDAQNHFGWIGVHYQAIRVA